MKLEINKELQELIPALDQRELDKLIASIRSEGCREPITVWNNIIIDGHNRYGICTKFNIAFATEQIEFENESQAKIWIINNQLGRRNLSIEHVAKLVCKLAEAEQEITNKQKPASKSRKEATLKKLAKGSISNTPYIFLYSKWDKRNNCKKQAERSNCNKSEKLQMCTDCIVETVYDICNQGEISQFRKLVQKFATEIMQKEADSGA